MEYIELIEEIREELLQIVNQRCDALLWMYQNGEQNNYSWAETRECRLAWISPATLKGKRPLSLTFPSGETVVTPTWKKLARTILKHCNEQPDMAKGTEKVRTGFYIEKDVFAMANGLLEAANVRSRNEFVTEALKFYCGYLNSRKAEDYLLQSLSSVLTSTVQDTENRLARMDFKIAVELSMLAHMIAYHSESRIDENAFRKLHAKCVEEVKRLNGAVELGDAYKYLKREN